MGILLFLRPEMTAEYETERKLTRESTLRVCAGRDLDGLNDLAAHVCRDDPATLDIPARARARGALEALHELIERAEAEAAGCG